MNGLANKTKRPTPKGAGCEGYDGAVIWKKGRNVQERKPCVVNKLYIGHQNGFRTCFTFLSDFSGRSFAYPWGAGGKEQDTSFSNQLPESLTTEKQD